MHTLRKHLRRMEFIPGLYNPIEFNLIYNIIISTMFYSYCKDNVLLLKLRALNDLEEAPGDCENNQKSFMQKI